MNDDQISQKSNLLRDKIEQRRRAAVEQEIRELRIAKTKGNAPTGATNVDKSPVRPSSNKLPDLPSAEEIVSPQQDSPVTRKAKRVFHHLTRREKTVLSAVGAITLIVMVLTGSFFMGNTQAADSAFPTIASLPLSDADSVVRRFKAVGVPVSNLKPYNTVKSQVWHNVTTAYEFTVTRGKDKGDFFLFGYTTTAQAQTDIFNLLAEEKYKNWGIYTYANITLISKPETATPIKTEMVSHLTQFLFAPYRSFWPTTTPAPSPTVVSATAKP
ncbi:MAG: hypothetical protein ABI947_21290 [Chloroflexota bacterium]